MSDRSLARELARFVVSASSSKPPQRALEIARTGMIDSIGVMIAGRSEPTPVLLEATLGQSAPEAHVAFRQAKSSAAHAAWIGATAAHVLDYDDVAVQGHPSAIMTPTLLAEAETLRLPGDRVLDAYVVGYEVWAELLLREPDHLHEKGWHPTGLFGVIGAAAACAALRGLDENQTSHALSLAASQSSGLMLNFGSMAKALTAGNAAHNGLIAARLAQAGVTAAADALGHRQGLLRAISPAGRVDTDRPVLAGAKWRILEEGLAIKKYPTCLSTHRMIDGIIELATTHDIAAAEVERIDVAMSARNARILHMHRPTNALEAKFSAEFSAAAAILKRRVSLEDMTDAFVRNPATQAFFPLVHVYAEGHPDAHTGYAPYDEVSISLKNGSHHRIRIAAARGSARLPLSEDELFKKFSACILADNSQNDARPVFEAISRLNETPDVAAFMTSTTSMLH